MYPDTLVCVDVCIFSLKDDGLVTGHMWPRTITAHSIIYHTDALHCSVSNVGKLHVKLHYRTQEITQKRLGFVQWGEVFRAVCARARCLLKTIAPDCAADQKGWMHATGVEKTGRREGEKKKLNGGVNEWGKGGEGCSYLPCYCVTLQVFFVRAGEKERDGWMRDW